MSRDAAYFRKYCETPEIGIKNLMQNDSKTKSAAKKAIRKLAESAMEEMAEEELRSNPYIHLK